MSGRDPLSGTTPVDSTGAPYPLATIDYYIVGTTTREDTYTTAALSVANSNPVTLGSDGRIPEIFFGQTRMKRVFKDADGNTISGLSWDGIDKTKQRIKSASAPSPTYPGLEWHDTSTGNLKERNSANNGWIDRGSIDSVGNTASVTEVLAGTETAKFVTPDALAGLWQRGSNITPSAGTVSLPSTGGGVFNIAAGDFSAISTGLGGRTVRFIFGGKSIITHNATSMILPDGVNVVTAAGDVMDFTNEAAADSSGTNWRCTKGPKGSFSSIAAKTTNYTATTADRNKSITFSGMSADSTLTLPAAADCGAGFLLFISNADTSASNYGVTVDGNASETIDGFTTRKMHRGSRIAIMCDGSNWRTVMGAWRYVSPATVLAAATAGTLTHNLGVRPERVWAYFICTTGEAGYTAGDYLVWSNAGDQNTANIYGLSIAATSTSVLTYSVGTTSIFRAINLSTGAAAVLTAANWSLVVVAEA